MAKLTPQQINEINEVIAEITKVVTPTSEIGACDKPTLSGLLTSHGIDKEATFFKCRRELSNDIVTFFVKDKGVAKSRFDRHAQTHIFVMEQNGDATASRPEPAKEATKAAPSPAPVVEKKAEAPAPKQKAVETPAAKKATPAKKAAPAKKAPAKKSAPASKAKSAKKTATPKAKSKPAAKGKKK